MRAKGWRQKPKMNQYGDRKRGSVYAGRETNRRQKVIPNNSIDMCEKVPGFVTVLAVGKTDSWPQNRNIRRMYIS